MTATYTALANVTLGSSASTVTFSSIPATYRDLVLVAMPIGTTANGLWIRFNNDTGTNYPVVQMTGNGSTASSTVSTSLNYITSGQDMATTVGLSVILNIMDYSQTNKHKTVLIRADRFSTGTRASATRWASTNALTTITLSHQSDQLATGSTFALYGIAA